MTPATRSTLDVWREDIASFSADLLQIELWPHQVAATVAPRVFKLITAARQTGKSTLLAVVAIHAAFTRPGSTSLIISAGEGAAKELMDDIITMLARAELLRGSVTEEQKRLVVLSNGAKIIAVPTSVKQIRGVTCDGVLVLDEAAYMDESIWRAALYTIAAVKRPLVYLASTPWGGPDHFFRHRWTLGQDPSDPDHWSAQWTYEVSPKINKALLEREKERSDPVVYRAEVLGEWVDEVGSYFTSEEILNATADYDLLPPSEATGEVVTAGIDWGVSYDSNAIVTVAAMRDWGKNGDKRQPVYIVPWLQERRAGTVSYDQFIGEIAEASIQRRKSRRVNGYHFGMVVAETNGVGQYPAEDLAKRLGANIVSEVVPVSRTWETMLPWTTTARNKQDAFGRVRGLLQAGRLVLPRHPELMRQLSHLRFTMAERTLKIEADSPAVHDDLADALALAVAGTAGYDRRRWPVERFEMVVCPGERLQRPPEEFVTTLAGTVVSLPLQTALAV